LGTLLLPDSMSKNVSISSKFMASPTGFEPVSPA
jgi:hypothetical protein